MKDPTENFDLKVENYCGGSMLLFIWEDLGWDSHVKIKHSKVDLWSQSWGIRRRRSVGFLVVKLVNSRFSVKYVLKKESGEAIEKDNQCTDTCIHVYMLLSMEIHIAHTHTHTTI